MSFAQPNPPGGGFSVAQLDIAQGQILEAWGGWSGAGGAANPLPVGPALPNVPSAPYGLVQPLSSPGATYGAYFRNELAGGSLNAGSGDTGPRATQNVIVKPSGGFGLFHQFIIPTALPALEVVGFNFTSQATPLLQVNQAGQNNKLFGICADSGDGNYQVFRDAGLGGGTVKFATTLAKASTGYFAVSLSCPIGGASMRAVMYYSPDSFAGATLVIDQTFTDNLPAPATPMQYWTFFNQIGTTAPSFHFLYARWFVPFPSPLPSPIG